MRRSPQPFLFRRNQKYQSTRSRHRNNVDIYWTVSRFGCSSQKSTSTAASNPTALHRSLASPRVEPNHWRTLYRLTVPDSINCDEYFEITPKQIHFPIFFSLCDMNYRYCFRPSKPHSPNIFKQPYNANNALTASRQYFAFALSLASLNYSLYTY